MRWILSAHEEVEGFKRNSKAIWFRDESPHTSQSPEKKNVKIKLDIITKLELAYIKLLENAIFMKHSVCINYKILHCKEISS